MHTDKARAEFEAAYRTRYGSMPMMWSDSVAGYLSAHAAGAWWAWQASRRELVIQLPEKLTCDDGYPSDDMMMCNEHNRAVDKCRAAIEAAGVKVKE